jgi:hypothetical protein
MPVEFHPTVQLAVGDYSPVYAGGRVGLWQGWENPNCSVAATRTSTWGALKSAYR